MCADAPEASLRHSYGMAAKQRDAYAEELQQAKSKLAETQASAAEQETQLTAALGNMARMTGALQHIQGRLENIEDKYRESILDGHDLENVNDDLRNEIERMKERVHRPQAQLEDDVKVLKAEVGQLETQLSDKRRGMASVESHLRDLHYQQKAIEVQLQSALASANISLRDGSSTGAVVQVLDDALLEAAEEKQLLKTR